jgi:hypothetical protein
VVGRSKYTLTAMMATTKPQISDSTRPDGPVILLELGVEDEDLRRHVGIDVVAADERDHFPAGETKVRSTLGQFLAGCVEWPVFEAFQAAGLALLYRQVELNGGKRRWAADFGLPIAAPRDPAEGWTDERVRGALDRFLAGRRAWPPTKDFASAGLQTARLAVGRTGGPERWAGEYGLTLDPARRTRLDTWTDDRIASELHPLLSGRLRWPPKSTFVEAGLGSLYSAIQRRGTISEWAERFGLRPPPARNRPATLWTDEHIEATLTALVREHGRWPRFVEFRAAGVQSLYERLRRDGRVAEWVERLGV